MITSRILQAAYTDLYVVLSEYIWDFDTVSAIADLEVASYQTFPDIGDIKRKLSKLKQLVQHSDVWDDDIDAVFSSYEELLEDNEVYADLAQFREVVK